jgi:hypothetical protein
MVETELTERQMGSAREVAERIAGNTIPGRSNSKVVNNIRGVDEVVQSFIEDINNWFEIVDVRVYRDGKIGLPCRYRWTIKRWASNDMDQWLMDNGWELLHHRKADSKEHRSNEMEARYRKEIEGREVYANMYVEFTEDVFEALQEDSVIKSAEENVQREQKAKDILTEKRRS